MGTHRYEYNQNRVRIHIIMGSQILVYYTREYPFNYPPCARDEFYPRVPVCMGIFVTPMPSTFCPYSYTTVSANLLIF